MTLKLSQLAGVWSKDPVFIGWLNRHLDEAGDIHSARYGVGDQDLDPAVHIRKVCKVRSRRDLDSNQVAADTFNREIRRPFMVWANRRTREATQ